jgi:hypothetical protein
VRIANGEATLDSLRGRHGEAWVSLSGTIAAADSPAPRYDLAVQATDLALDAELAAALPPEPRLEYQAFHAAGKADVTGGLKVSGDGPPEYQFNATLKGVSFSYQGFPYPVCEAIGVLHFTPARAVVERLVARCGPPVSGAGGEARPAAAAGTVTVSGQIDLTKTPAGVDLTFEASDLPLDRRLREALPEVRRLIGEGRIRPEDFQYPKYNSCEIIP